MQYKYPRIRNHQIQSNRRIFLDKIENKYALINVEIEVNKCSLYSIASLKPIKFHTGYLSKHKRPLKSMN